MSASDFGQLLDDDLSRPGRLASDAPPCDGIEPQLRLQAEAMIAEIDRKIADQLNPILHHPEFQAIEATWRGLLYLVDGAEGDQNIKIRLLDISKADLVRTLGKFRGTAWDQSPIFRKIYEEEFGQLGGEPYGVLLGDYAFDHSPRDVRALGDIAQIAAAAHAPFIAAAAPSLMHMDSWAELINPSSNLTKIFQTPDYASWRALRDSEDSRYLGLCMPRLLLRLPYGIRTEPVEKFEFEEDVEGEDAGRYLWGNPAYAMVANVVRSFRLYGWCARIRGIEMGGAVEGLPALMFPTADGDVDRRCATEVALSERREVELGQSGLIPLVHRKNADYAAFIGAQSLQKASEYEDPAATANAHLSSRLPYLFACCRFAHYLKGIARAKVGQAADRALVQTELERWLRQYVDGAPDGSSEEWQARRPLAEARIDVVERDDDPGRYDIRMFLRPHYQLEGLTAALRLVSRLPEP
jgi:type VI secretion system protein ImpC